MAICYQKAQIINRQFRKGLLWVVLLVGYGLGQPLQAIYDDKNQPKSIQVSNEATLFGVREARSEDMRAFTKWKGMWMRYHKAQAADANKPKMATSADKPLSPLQRAARRRDSGYSSVAIDEFVAGLRGKTSSQQVKAINSYINLRRYIIDPVNWSLPDYWATPKEFFRKDGDCEDYAISKYILLKKLGFDGDSMRIAVVQDENLKVAHAILAVYLDGDILVLDNQFNQPLSHTKIHHYRPIYTINESAWWIHRNGQ